jgi:hypothetical protein
MKQIFKLLSNNKYSLVKLRSFIIIFIIFCSFSLYAGHPYDSLYIGQYKQKYNIKTDFFIKAISLSFSTNTIDTSSLTHIVTYLPNIKACYSISMSGKGWGAGFAFKLPTLGEYGKVMGKTKYTDFKFSYLMRELGFITYYRNYKGFFLSQPKLLDPTWNGGAYPQRGDLHFTSMGMGGYYLFNEGKFSMKAVLSHTEKQKISAGSFLMFADAQLSRVSADSSIIPPGEELKYEKMSGLKGYSFASLSLMGGYAYNFVFFRNFYICPMLNIGTGYQLRKMDVDEGEVNRNNAFLTSNFKLAYGYRGKIIYVGALFEWDSNQMVADAISLNASTYLSSFFIGFRFGKNK